MEKRRVKIAVKDDCVEWVVVKFREDGVISQPLRLNDIEEEETGQNGLETNLQEGDICLAPFDDGRFYPAKILLRTDDKEKALKDRMVFKTVDQNGEKTKKKVIGKQTKRKKDDDSPESQQGVTDESVATKAKPNSGKQTQKKKKEVESQDNAEDLVKKKKKELAEEKKREKAARSSAMQKVASMLFSNKSDNTEVSESSANPSCHQSVCDNMVQHDNMPFQSGSQSSTVSTSQPNQIGQLPTTQPTHQSSGMFFTPASHVPGIYNTPCNVSQHPYSPGMAFPSTSQSYFTGYTCNTLNPYGHEHPSSMTVSTLPQHVSQFSHSSPSVTQCTTPLAPSVQSSLPCLTTLVTPSSTNSSTHNMSPLPYSSNADEPSSFNSNLVSQNQADGCTGSISSAISMSVSLEDDTDMGHAISETSGYTCTLCPLKDITIRDLRLEIRTLKEELADAASKLVGTRETADLNKVREDNKNERLYYPKTRPRLQLAKFYEVDPGNPKISEGFIHLAPGANIAVEINWLHSALASVKGTGTIKRKKERKTSSGAIIKRLIDGFYEYADLAVDGGTKVFADCPIYKSLLRYAQHELKMSTADFNLCWNEKMGSARKIKNRLKKLSGKKSATN